MPKERADHHDAQLVLQVYELRREPVMRQSRDLLNGQFWPKTYDELIAITKADHPMNPAWRQCVSFWEMVYGMVKHGIVNPDYFLESNGEGFFLYGKVRPWLEQYRQETSPTAFGNAEWVATQTEAGRRISDAIFARVQKSLAARA